MATCKWCRRSGWFLLLTEDGVCKTCNPGIALEVASRGRVITESMDFVRNSKKLDTALSRCDVIIQQASALVPYEEAGVPTIQPAPSALVQQYKRAKDALIRNSLEEEFGEVQRKVALTTGSKSKVTHLQKLALRVHDFRGRATDLKALDDLERRVRAAIHSTQLEGYLDQAKRFEFKGNKKKALDLYYDALYFLKHDDIDDSLQTEHIKALEAKIEQLGGRREPSA